METIEERTKDYPKTYKEYNRIMGVELWNTLWGEDATEYEEQMEDLINAFIRLKVCRDAYWKIAGEEMGLGEPWKPNQESQDRVSYPSITPSITRCGGEIIRTTSYTHDYFLIFPTAKMRNAFYENFKELIENCKELL